MRQRPAGNTRLILAEKKKRFFDVQAVGGFPGDNGRNAGRRRRHLCADNTNSMGIPVDQVFAIVLFKTDNPSFILFLEGIHIF